MSTGKTFTNFVFKRLLAAEDFSTRFLYFLLDSFREVVVRVFDADGIFDAKITFAGSASNTVTFAQGAPGDFRGTDGLGNILGLGESGSEDESIGQIKVVVFENTNAVDYHFSLEYATRPKGIQINPRNGRPEYTEIVQSIGKSAAPNSIVDNGSNLTLVIDSVCETSHSHAGRKAIIYLNTPDKNAITETIAIEECTVTWNGVNNRITTAALLGQNSPSTTPGDYTVMLLGPSVRKVNTVAVSGHIYLGNITGNGGVPGAGDNSSQNLIDSSLSTLLLYPGGSNWADGTSNPATTIIDQLDKIVADLTSTSGGRGLAKLTAAARSNWHDGTTNPTTIASTALNKIITDLVNNSGSDRIGSAQLTNAWLDTDIIAAGSIKDQLEEVVGDLTSTSGDRGAGKITNPARASWADGTANAAASVSAAIAKIVTDLTSTTGDRGLGKITAPARSNWYDGTTNVAANADDALDKIITDLTTTLGNRGADKISAEINVNWHDGHSFASGSIHDLLAAIVTDLSADGFGSDRIDSEEIGNNIVAGFTSDVFVVSAGSIKDQLQEIINELTSPTAVAFYAARNYNVIETVLGSSFTIRSFFPNNSSGSIGWENAWYAVGDDGAGTVSNIRYAQKHLGDTWTTGPAWNGTFVDIVDVVAMGGSQDRVIAMGHDSTGVLLNYTDDDMGGVFSSSSPSGRSDLTGKALHLWSARTYLGSNQNVAGTGDVILYTDDISGGWAVPTTIPSTCRGIYAFAHSTANDYVVAGGIDSSGKIMFLRSAVGSPETWTDVTPASPQTGRVYDLVYDWKRSVYWALATNGEIYRSDSVGQNWVKKANGLNGTFGYMAIDSHGILVFSDSTLSQLFGVTRDVVNYDEISIGEETHWSNGYKKVRNYRGKFICASGNDLLVSGTFVFGESSLRYIGSE